MKSKSTIKLTQTETSKTVEFSIPNEEAENVTAGLLKNNHLKGLYSNYCILNQEFLGYIVSLKLKPAEYRILFFIMSKMDKENKVLLNNHLFIKKLEMTEMTVIQALKRLFEFKILLRQKIDVMRYEYEINYDCINPQFAFKNKSTRENIVKHKTLISQETPYIKQYNTDGNLDLINKQSGEIFETIKQFEKKVFNKDEYLNGFIENNLENPFLEENNNI
jgi:hypothetical protein